MPFSHGYAHIHVSLITAQRLVGQNVSQPSQMNTMQSQGNLVNPQQIQPQTASSQMAAISVGNSSSGMI